MRHTRSPRRSSSRSFTTTSSADPTCRSDSTARRGPAACGRPTTSYSRLLLSDFLANGGQIEIREFHTPADLAALPERTLINATGYGARALFNDESITPVRGQLARDPDRAEAELAVTTIGKLFPDA